MDFIKIKNLSGNSGKYTSTPAQLLLWENRERKEGNDLENKCKYDGRHSD
jgi:hypothetical protein